MIREKLKKLISSPALKDIRAWSMSIRGSIILICLISLLSSAGSLVIAVATKGLIDGAGAHDGQKLIRHAVELATVVLVIRAMGVLSSRLSAKADAVFARELRALTLRKILRKQYASLDGYHSGELINRLFSDVNVVKGGVLSIVPSLVSMTVSFGGAAVILISMDWRFIVLIAAGGLLGSALLLAFKEPMKKRHKAMQAAEDKLHSFLQENLENISIIKAGSSEKRVERQADDRQSEYTRVQLKNANFSIWMNSGIGLVFQLSWLLCMLWGGVGIYRGVLTYGSLASVIQLVNFIQSPIAGAANVAAQAYRTVSSAERLKEIMDLPDESAGKAIDVDRFYEKLQKIRLNNVTFAYDTDTVLKNLSAEICRGDFAALTGISGGGKSTLFRLLLGLYPPNSGTIELVTDMGTEMPANRTRALFGYVPQGNYLFSGSLRENLTMFTDGATDEEILEAARIACIDGFIEGLENGLDTELGERGLGLSEGQAQRVAVARMLLCKAPILLLDESTSALDEQTEAKLLENISRMRSKTCIIVTHRRAALQICDYQLHLEDGKIRRIAEKAPNGK